MSRKASNGVNELVVGKGVLKPLLHEAQAQRSPPFFHRLTSSVTGRFGGLSSGEVLALGGALISCKAWVGQEPMQDKHPTHCSSTTTTGRLAFVRSGGDTRRGSSASNGQWEMHKSHPVQSDSMIATIDCPMFLASRHAS